MQVQSLGKEDPQKEGMTTHSSILVWRISWTEETGGLQSMRSRRVGHYYHFSMQSTSKSLGRFQLYELYSPQNSPGQNTRVGSHFLLSP